MAEACLAVVASLGFGLLLHARSRARAIRQRRESARDALMQMVLTKNEN